MKYLNAFIVLLLIFTISLPLSSLAQESNLAPLGFKFGIDKKDARNVIDSNGKRIVKDYKDSKDMRIIIMQGVIVETPIDTSGKDVMTELEFYDKKLLSTSLIFAAADQAEEAQVASEFEQYFTAEYGEPYEKDDMLYFKTTSWHIPDIMLVLHANEKTNTVKVEYKYKPGHVKRFEDKLDIQRGTVPKDPAKQMFLEGDYSKPTTYDEEFGTQ